MSLPITALRRVLLVGLAVTGDACQRQEPPSVARLAGCWAFQRQDGSRAPLGLEMPDTVQLDSAAKRNPDGTPNPFFPLKATVLSRHPRAGLDSLRLDATHVVPWPPDWKNYYALVAWRFDAPDSVRITLFANMSKGWDVQLRVQGDSLVGRAVQESDVIADTIYHIPLVAQRALCSQDMGADFGDR